MKARGPPASARHRPAGCFPVGINYLHPSSSLHLLYPPPHHYALRTFPPPSLPYGRLARDHRSTAPAELGVHECTRTPDPATRRTDEQPISRGRGHPESRFFRHHGAHPPTRKPYPTRRARGARGSQSGHRDHGPAVCAARAAAQKLVQLRGSGPGGRAALPGPPVSNRAC